MTLLQIITKKYYSIIVAKVKVLNMRFNIIYLGTAFLMNKKPFGKHFNFTKKCVKSSQLQQNLVTFRFYIKSLRRGVFLCLATKKGENIK